MLRWFKRHFIPHKGNEYQPYLLRGKGTRLFVLAVFLIELGVLALPFIPAFNLGSNSFLAAILPAVLDDLTNQNRQSKKLTELIVSPLLNTVAESKARDMAASGYFSHVSPEGKTPWYWFNQAGYKYEYAGENLAIDFNDSRDVTLAWMNSPSHRANIMKNAYTEIGTGMATGTYEGKPTIFVVQVYGKPQGGMFSSGPKSGITLPANMTTAVTLAPVGIVTVPMGTMATSSKVMGASIEVATGTQSPPVVATAPSPTYSKSTVFERYLTSPRHIANIFFCVIGILVAAALIFTMFIRMNKKHLKLITNGLIVLVLITGVYVVNNVMAQSKLAITTSFMSF